MRKYAQISFVLGVFGILVFLRQFKGNEQPIVVGNQQSSSSNLNSALAPSSNSSSTSGPMMQQTITGTYKNGTYTGSIQDAFYGNVQVQVAIANGKISSVNFLQYPNDNRTSQFVNSQAIPMLQQEAIQAQSAKVDIISGASATSQAFQASLSDALAQAK